MSIHTQALAMVAVTLGFIGSALAVLVGDLTVAKQCGFLTLCAFLVGRPQ